MNIYIYVYIYIYIYTHTKTHESQDDRQIQNRSFAPADIAILTINRIVILTINRIAILTINKIAQRPTRTHYQEAPCTLSLKVSELR